MASNRADKDSIEKAFENKVRLVLEDGFNSQRKIKIKHYVYKFLEIYLSKNNEESLQELKVEVKEMNKEGTKETFEINSHLVTDKGSYHSEKTGWDLNIAIRSSMNALEEQVFGVK